MKRFILLFLASLSLASHAATPPNIVLIIADDLAWDDTSPYGHPTIHTPNLQRLADSGMRFDNAFLTISSCSPSRASIITGRYPHNTGAEELHWPVPKKQITFTEHLRSAGYWTAAAGKWHLGDHMRDRFDEIREADTSGFQLPPGAQGADAKFVETTTGEAQSGCTDWVPLLKDRPRDKPFFLWLAALDPHRPYHEKITKKPTNPNSVRLPPYHADDPQVRADYALYYDEIERLDRYVGAVLDELDAQKVAGNTLVLFISDNGRPFHRDKTTVYDSGIKTPFIARWPAAIKPGTTCNSLVSSVDLAPTFLKLAGATPPSTLAGVDASPLLTDPLKSIRPYAFAEKNWHDIEDHVRAARDTRYKYIRNGYTDLPQTPPADSIRSISYRATQKLLTDGKLDTPQKSTFTTPRPTEELYDCQNDPHEIDNLANDPTHSQKLTELRSALDTWIHLTRDYTPKLRTADEFDRTTGAPTAARVRPRKSRAEMVAGGLAAP